MLALRLNLGWTAAANVLLALLLFAAGRLGLSFAVSAPYVSPIWPPTGIALAAVLLLGYRMWPGIALAALLVNVSTNAPIAPAPAIAAGNTLEALAAAWLLNRVRFDPAMLRLHDVWRFLLLATALSTLISATVGTTALVASGIEPTDRFDELWSLWWLGNAMGAMILTPVILTWTAPSPFKSSWQQTAELLAVCGVLLIVSAFIFIDPLPEYRRPYPLHFVLLAIVLWPALRLGQRGATAATLLIAVTATWGTVNNGGPFARPDRTQIESYILLIVFLGVVAVTAMTLAASMSQYKLLTLRLEDRVNERTGELRRLAWELAQTERNERRKLAQILHDQLQQILVAAKLQAQTLHHTSDPTKRDAGLTTIEQFMTEAIDTSRSLTLELSPPVLDTGGLREALQWLARRMQEKYGLRVELDLPPIEESDLQTLRWPLFTATRELLFNVVKHAKVDTANLALHRLPDGAVEVAVADNGRGFDPASLQRAERNGNSYGLATLCSRIELLGGHCNIQTAPNQGARITLTVPGGQAD